MPRSCWLRRSGVWWCFLIGTCDWTVGFSILPTTTTRQTTGLERHDEPFSVLLSSSSSETTSTTTTTNGGLDALVWSEDRLMEFANQEGLVLSLTTLGPGYRGVARAKHNTSIIVGYCEGFLRPGGRILHLDKMEVFKKMVTRTRRENRNEFRGGGTYLGVGLLLGYLCLLHGRDNGCTEAEFLAIDDAPDQHRRLVNYYAKAGFAIIKYVGDGMGDIPDRLVWGGCGTLMRKGVHDLLTDWTGLLETSWKRKQQQQQQQRKEEEE